MAFSMLALQWLQLISGTENLLISLSLFVLNWKRLFQRSMTKQRDGALGPWPSSHWNP
jgi:hypothetical protein